jgi:GNAT superfamily N-acetyltransferase
MASAGDVEVHPVTPGRWRDLVELFGEERGAYGGCWCMYFRLASTEFHEGARDHGRRNRAAMKAIVGSGSTPGLLAYMDGGPVGWVSVAPREEFGKIGRARSTKPVDDKPAWSIVCFYIDRHHRGDGVGTALLRAAVDYAREKGARLVEGYPVDPRRGKIPNAEAYYGLVSMFESAGFREVERRTPSRPIMRRALRPRR